MNSSVRVDDLQIVLSSSGRDIADEISFSIAKGEVLGLVGESGSGKTTVGTALLAFSRKGAQIAGGSVRVDGADILHVNDKALRGLRGKLVAYVPQDPATALNPSLQIGLQLRELLDEHEPMIDRAGRLRRILEALEDVNLPATEAFIRRLPHQLSGGQQQRVCLAMAFLLRPTLIVLDEPTTGLDVTTQAHVLRTVRRLCKTHNVAALYVTHDLAVVANLADRVLVLYAGRVAEIGPTREVFLHSGHPYTRKLIEAIPEISQPRILASIPGHAPSPGQRGNGCFFAPRCDCAIEKCTEIEPPLVEISPDHISRCHRAHDSEVQGPSTPAVPQVHDRAKLAPVLDVKDLNASFGIVQVLHDISFELAPMECLALVGGSGSGKSTLARSIIGLMAHRSGDIRLNGKSLAKDARSRTPEHRRALQYVFQNPYSSLNPRKTIRQSLELPLHQFFKIDAAESEKRAVAALERVNLPARALDQYPDQMSGGERQRVAIARALVCRPKVLVCDEVTSALDVSVQAAIVNLLRQLQEEEELSLLFITHNLGLVRSIADRVIVMKQGSIVEAGRTDTVLVKPSVEYTRQLLADTPQLFPEVSDPGNVVYPDKFGG